MSPHPSASELAKHLHCRVQDVYDAFASIGALIGNVPRYEAVQIVRGFLEGE